MALDWTGWRGANRDAVVAWLPERLPESLTPDWSVELSSDGVGGIAVAGGLVLVGGRDIQDSADLWMALDAKTGQIRWQVMYSAPGNLDYGNTPRATPLYADGIVYLQGAFGHLHAVDAATGLVLWQLNLAETFDSPRLEWGLTASPILADGKLLVQPGGRKAGLVALDPATGEVLWKTAGHKPGHASLVVASMAGTRQLIGYDSTSLGGWSLADGTRLWQIKPRLSGDFNVPTPIVLGVDRLFVCTENNGARIYRFDSNGPTELPVATSDLLMPDSHTPVTSQGRVYGVTDGLHCLDAADGLRPLWVLDDDAFYRYSSLIICGRRLMAFTEDGELLLVEDQGRAASILDRRALTMDVGGILSHPALVGTKLFVRLGTRLCCYDLSPAGH